MSNASNRIEYDEKLLQNAAYFVITEFCGRAQYRHRARRSTQKAIEKRYKELKAKEPTARLLIYGINQQFGRDITVHVNPPGE